MELGAPQSFRRIDIMRSGQSTTQTVRYWRMLRVSDTADDENRKTCWPIPVAGPMGHDGGVFSGPFRAARERWATASGGDKTVRVWDEASGKTIGEPMRHDDAVLSCDHAPSCSP